MAKITRHTRYLPTVYVDQAAQLRLREGSLILQPGQWIILATSGRRARWAGVSAGGTLTIQHHKHRLRGYPLDGLRRLINFANARKIAQGARAALVIRAPHSTHVM